MARSTSLVNSRPRAAARSRLTMPHILTHIGAWIPLAVLVYDFANNRLTVNPIQEAEIRTGDIAL
ncbi:MAG: hypothetical protein EHM21_17575, partial [Chloroflexi bacterium]